MSLNRPVIQIFAKTVNGVIGDMKTNDLPFKSSVDMQAFKKYTSGNIVIMGRLTAQSLNYKPLPNRINVIISHELREDTVPGFKVYNSVEKLMEDVQDPNIFDLEPLKDKRNTRDECIFVIGGAQTFKLLEPYTRFAVVTIIDKFIKITESSVCYSGKDELRYVDYRALPLDKEGDDKVKLHVIWSDFNVCNQIDNFDIIPEVASLFSYNCLVREILDCGDEKKDRTGTGTKSVFGYNLSFHDVNVFPPFLTTRKLPLKSTIGELLWFINGCTDARLLKDEFKCSFWDEWQNKDGDVGPMYGAQWRGKSNGKDQLKDLLNRMVHDPFSRRLLVDAWVPELLPDSKYKLEEQADNGLMTLAPCHFAFQLNITENYEVDLQWYQRSADVALGLPVNIASYYILLCLLCKAATEMTKGEVVYTPRSLFCSLGDAHIYNNHVAEAYEMVERRELRVCNFELPDNVLQLFDIDVPLETLKEYQQKIYDGIKDYDAHPNFKLARNV